MILIFKYTFFKTIFFKCQMLNLLPLRYIHLNTFLWYDLPDALQWQWFFHVGILSVFPPQVERYDSPNHNIFILR